MEPEHFEDLTNLSELAAQVRSTRTELQVLTDRLYDLETSTRPVPFLLPLRKTTQVAAIASSVLTCLAVLFAISPHDIEIRGWRYKSQGIPAEAIASFGAAVGVWITVQKHLKDKDDYRRNHE